MCKWELSDSGYRFYQSYSTVSHADSLIINISIAVMNKLTARILDVSNAFQNTNVSIYERVCVSPPPYYLHWFERSCPNVPLNWDEGPFCLQYMNVIQGKKPAEQQWNRLLDAVVAILKYKKITIYHAVYIKVFSDGTVSYLKVSTDDIISNTYNEAQFTELTRVLKQLLRWKSKKDISLST